MVTVLSPSQRSKVKGLPFDLRRHRRQLAAGRPVTPVSEQVIGLHDLVNLARPLVDDRALAVAIEPSDRIFVGITVRAVYLDRVAGRTLGRDRRKPLGQSGLARVAAA